MPDTSRPYGTWYLKTWYASAGRTSPEWPEMAAMRVDDDVRRTLWPIRVTLTENPTPRGELVADADGIVGRRVPFALEDVRWDHLERLLTFWQVDYDAYGRWYRGHIIEGVFVGRFTDIRSRGAAPPSYDLGTYPHHVRGWNAEYIDRDRDHLEFEVMIENGAPDLPESAYNDAWRRFDGLPRIPRNRVATVWFQRVGGRADEVIGRLKIFGWPTQDSNAMDPRFRGPGRVQRLGEEIEYDLTNVTWVGNNVSFQRVGNGDLWTERYDGTIDGRWIRGTWRRKYNPRRGEEPTFRWRGVRARALGYGLREREAEQRTEWQERARAQLRHLLMGRVQVRGTRYHVGRALSSEPAPVPGRALPSEPAPIPTVRTGRDDYGPDGRHRHGSRPYTFRELHLEYDLDFVGLPETERHTRRIHAFVSVPDGGPPSDGTGFPVLVAVNGHQASAFLMMRPGEEALRSPLGARIGDTVPSTGGGGTCQRVNIYAGDARIDGGTRIQWNRCEGLAGDVPDFGEFYGDAFARRGFVVLAVDTGHRGFREHPLSRNASGAIYCGPEELRNIVHQAPYLNYSDRTFWLPDVYGAPGGAAHRYYGDGVVSRAWLAGDDPYSGNGLHPWIAPNHREGYPNSSDWVEDGERVWDVQQALTFLLSHANGRETPLNGGRPLRLDSDCIGMIGLSMGGEVTTIMGALDPRITVTMAGGWCPDAGLFTQSGANHPCGTWSYTEFSEYIDTADYHALVAPRPMIVLTGQGDETYSYNLPAVDGLDPRPFYISDREVLRRGQVAFRGALHRYIHHLHSYVLDYDVRVRHPMLPTGFRVSTRSATHTLPTEGTTTQTNYGPAPGMFDWQARVATAAITGLRGLQLPTNLVDLTRALCRDYHTSQGILPIFQKREIQDKHWSVEKTPDLKPLKELAENHDDRARFSLPVVPERMIDESVRAVGRAFIQPQERPQEQGARSTRRERPDRLNVRRLPR